jgi:hypothetical protein
MTTGGRQVGVVDYVKERTPWPIRRVTRRLKREFRWAHTAWRPVGAVFGNIYQRNMWGGESGSFYSGPGSDSLAAKLYTEGIKAFIADHNVKSVVDLGCGDFRVASSFLSEDVSYVGVDIVEALIRENIPKYRNEKIDFACLNIIEDRLPKGELCLMREVLQHLSNAQILKIIPKLREFKFAIYTDYQPASGVRCRPNRDISHGVDIRIWRGSALFLDQPPFNVPMRLLFDAPASTALLGPGERICTYLLWP